MALAVRKSASTLTSTERERFVAAVLELKRRGVYDSYVHVHASHGNFAHTGPGFLPWHREFLRRFEVDLQGIDPTVTVPYWDWTIDGASSSIWDADFMGGNGRQSDGKVMDGPFAFDAGDWDCVAPGTGIPDFLRRRFGDSGFALPSVTDVTACLIVTPYDHEPWDDDSKPSFRNQLEGWIPPGIHNNVHKWVGGSMLPPTTSPNDPVFFLNHSNVDRLWAEWQGLHPMEPFVPTSGARHGHNLNDPMHPWGTTIVSTLRHHALGYCYDTESKPDLLLYDRSAGHGAFYTNVGRGRLRFLRLKDTWRKSWTHIIPGNFSGNGFTDLLFYDAAAGRGAFYSTDGLGNIHRLHVNEGWRKSWTHIIPGNFSGNGFGFTDLLFYAAAGRGAFYSTDGLGNIHRLHVNEDWRKSWTHIIPGNFSGGQLN